MATPTPPDRQLLRLDEVVREALSFLHHEIQKHKIATELDFPSLPVMVCADRVQLQQVIVNLVINAVQAMERSDPSERELTVQMTLPGDGEVAVEVRDSGPGIPDGDNANLFTSFYTTKQNGLGIGLPISRSIIETCGGKLTAANRRDGRGAVFRFTLPLYAGDETARPPDAFRVIIGKKFVTAQQSRT